MAKKDMTIEVQTRRQGEADPRLRLCLSSAPCSLSSPCTRGEARVGDGT